MKYTLLIIALLFPVCCVASSIVLRNGKVVEGTIVDQSENSIRLRDKSGIVLTIKKADIDENKTNSAAEQKTEASSKSSKTATPASGIQEKTISYQKSLPKLVKPSGPPKGRVYSDKDILKEEPQENKKQPKAVIFVLVFSTPGCEDCWRMRERVREIEEEFPGQIEVLETEFDKEYEGPIWQGSKIISYKNGATFGFSYKIGTMPSLAVAYADAGELKSTMVEGLQSTEDIRALIKGALLRSALDIQIQSPVNAKAPEDQE